MARFELQFNLQSFREGIIRTGNGWRAMGETLYLVGAGETITSRRKKVMGEKKKPPHGRFIAWFFREKLKRDVFAQAGEEFNKIHTKMVVDLSEALDIAYRKERRQERLAQGAVARAAKRFSVLAQQRVESGWLGDNRVRNGYRDKKTNLARAGVITSDYGIPAPRGIFTGRFVRGIRARWRQGRLNG